VAQHRIIAKDGTKETVPITISLGIATTSSHRCYTIDQLFSTADKNLYKAKEEGRNRIVSSELAE
jgi:diguanylate cyclase (GGDEF)-like protein